MGGRRVHLSLQAPPLVLLDPTLATLLLLCARPSCFPFLETGWPFSSSEQQVTGKGAWAAAP